MLLEQVRDDVVRVCRELASSGLVVGTSGNVSGRDGDLVAVSPSGVDYAELTADLVGIPTPSPRRRCRRWRMNCRARLRDPRLLPAEEIVLVASKLAG
jgi:Class II Aldolase and Adducin N-terminal domain